MNAEEAPKERIDDEVRLNDIIKVTQENWRVITGLSFLGLVFATILIVVASPQYEAKVQIEMAKVSTEKNAYTADLFARSVESPDLLVQRLRVPSSYTDGIVQECGLQREDEPRERLSKLLRVSTIQKVDTVAELSIRRATPELAKRCVAAVFQMIRNQQSALLQPYSRETLERVAALEAQLQTNRELLVDMKKSAIESTAYLATRDENLFLMKEIASLERSLAHVETRIISPVYVTRDPVYPRTTLTLTAGLTAGLILGIVVALGRSVVSKRQQVVKAQP